MRELLFLSGIRKNLRELRLFFKIKADFSVTNSLQHRLEHHQRRRLPSKTSINESEIMTRSHTNKVITDSTLTLQIRTNEFKSDPEVQTVKEDSVVDFGCFKSAALRSTGL